MASRTAVALIPYGGHEPHRHRAFLIVREFYWQMTDYPLIAVHGAETNKATALNEQVAMLMQDVLILNDADSLVPPHQLTQAVKLASEEPGLVFAYTRYRRIDQETTAQIKHPSDAFVVRDDQVEWEKVQSGSHGCVVIRRECFEQVGGLDPAFGMAGYEDLAFNVVCEAFWPSRRVAGDLFHLWHPRGWDADPEREAANLARYRNEYLARWGDREALLQVRGA